MESRINNSIKNITFSWGNQLLTVFLSFAQRSLFLMFLSVDYLGIQGLFGDILHMLTLADLGFGTAMTFSMYKPLAEGDYEKLSGLTHFYRKVYRVIAIAITLIGLGLIPFLGYLVNLPSELPHLRLYYVLFLADTVASYLFAYKTCIITADQKEYLLTKYQSIFNILTIIASCIFLVLTKNYAVFLIVQVVFTYLRNFYSAYKAEKLYPFIKKKTILPKEDSKGIFKNIGSVFLYKISSVLITATDNTLISVIVGTAFVGLYSNYLLVVGKLTMFANTLFYSITASLGNVIVKEKEEKRYEIFTIMNSVSTFLSTFCVICVLLLQQDLIRVWLGEKFMLDNLVVYASVTNFFFSIALMPIWVFREATGLYQKTKFVMLLTALVNIVVSIILGKLIGLAGIIFATSIARLSTYFWYEPRLLFREFFGKSCMVYYLNLAKSILVSAIIFACAYYVGRLIIVTGWGTLFLKGFAVAAVVGVLELIAYIRSSGAQFIIQQIKRVLTR